MVDFETYTGIYNHTPVQTTDATLTTIATIELPDYYSGLLEFSVVGLSDLGSGNRAAIKQIVDFKKTTTLTIGTPVNVFPLVDDFTIGGIALANSGENIVIQVTGVASTIINWVCRTQLLTTNATTLP